MDIDGKYIKGSVTIPRRLEKFPAKYKAVVDYEKRYAKVFKTEAEAIDWLKHLYYIHGAPKKKEQANPYPYGKGTSQIQYILDLIRPKRTN